MIACWGGQSMLMIPSFFLKGAYVLMYMCLNGKKR